MCQSRRFASCHPFVCLETQGSFCLGNLRVNVHSHNPIIAKSCGCVKTSHSLRQGCCKVLFCHLRRQGEGRRRSQEVPSFALRQGACSPLFTRPPDRVPRLFPILQQPWKLKFAS